MGKCGSVWTVRTHWIRKRSREYLGDNVAVENANKLRQQSIVTRINNSIDIGFEKLAIVRYVGSRAEKTHTLEAGRDAMCVNVLRLCVF